MSRKMSPLALGHHLSLIFTIGANLDPDQEELLVKFLRLNKEVFAWEPKQLAGSQGR